MVDKLHLPFPLLSDPDAAATSGWGVYDPVGGTHGPIARPAIFAVARDLAIPYEYVGRDFADRPPNADIFAALEAARDAPVRSLDRAVSGPGPRPQDAGNPADKPMPLDEIAPYFRGVRFASEAISQRTDDPTVKLECRRLGEIALDYMRAAIATWRLVRAG